MRKIAFLCLVASTIGCNEQVFNDPSRLIDNTIKPTLTTHVNSKAANPTKEHRKARANGEAYRSDSRNVTTPTSKATTPAMDDVNAAIKKAVEILAARD